MLLVFYLERKIGTRQMLYILLLFLIAQFSGLLLTVLAVPPSYAAIVQPPSTQSNPVSFVLWLIIDIIIIILILMLIIRYYRGDLFYKLLEAYIIIFGSFFLFFVLLGDILPNLSIIPISSASLILALALFIVKRKTKGLRNIITLITSIGAGLFIGISLAVNFGFLVVYLFLAFLAVYDYIAVFVLKFMIPLAKEAASRNLAIMIGSADLELLPSTGKKTSLSKKDLEKINNSRVRSLIKEGSVPVVSSIMLGNGDIILPLSLAVGAYAVYANSLLSTTIIIGSGTGLLITMMLLKRYKVGLPAIPPLFAFISIALAIFYLLSRPLNYLYVAIFSIASLLSLIAMFLTLRKVRAASLSSSLS